MYAFLNSKWYIDAVYNKLIISKSLQLGLVTANVLDRGVIELLGPAGVTHSLHNASNSLAKLDTGVVTHYALYMTISLALLVLLLFLPVFSGVAMHDSTWLFYVPAGLIAVVYCHSVNTAQL